MQEMFASRRVEVTDGIMLCSPLLLDHDWMLLAEEHQVRHSVTECLAVWLLIYLSLNLRVFPFLGQLAVSSSIDFMDCETGCIASLPLEK